MGKDSPGEGVLRLSPTGRIFIENYEAVLEEFKRQLASNAPSRLELDLAKIDYLDSAGGLCLKAMEQEAKKAGAVFVLLNQNEAVGRIIDLVNSVDVDRPPLIAEGGHQNFFDQVGLGMLALLRDFKDLTSFLGEFLIAMARCLRHPRLVRWGDTAFYMEQVGVEGLPIVGLISLLMGLIIAFMSSLQLSNFGANIYVASLVGLGMERELGPIMTAVLVAGRSGSAFAAEIGTMKVNEEVDALSVMGFDPTNFLAVPKVVAAMLMLPLLTIYSVVCGIAGGLIVGVTGLNLTVYAYLKTTMSALSIFGSTTALFKSVVFAMIIAGIGCQRGFTVRGGALGVGEATTSAVVSAMFMIIVADAGFAILFYYVW